MQEFIKQLSNLKRYFDAVFFGFQCHKDKKIGKIPFVHMATVLRNFHLLAREKEGGQNLIINKITTKDDKIRFQYRIRFEQLSIGKLQENVC